MYPKKGVTTNGLSVADNTVSNAAPSLCRDGEGGEGEAAATGTGGEVYGYWELINEAIVQTWTEESNPFDEDSDWSETPGAYEDTGVLIYVDIPLQEEEGGEFVRYLIIIAAGNIDGEPKCWLYDDGGVGGRGPGVWHDICCWAQKRICYLINEILGFIGDIICPTSYCDACAAECEDANKACLPPPRGNPCHSCGFCGGMWLLCHIVPGGHC